MNSDTLPMPICITISYDTQLQRITGKKSEDILISKDMPFILLLSILFKSYPEIEKQYPPGTLGLLHNNKPPLDFDALQEGDEVRLIGFLFHQ